MAINEEQRQLEIAAEVEELARALAHSTRDVPHPRDSYRLLGELGATIDHLAQVIDQLGKWHSRTEDGTHYDGEDGDGTGRGPGLLPAGEAIAEHGDDDLHREQHADERHHAGEDVLAGRVVVDEVRQAPTEEPPLHRRTSIVQHDAAVWSRRAPRSRTTAPRRAVPRCPVEPPAPQS